MKRQMMLFKIGLTVVAQYFFLIYLLKKKRKKSISLFVSQEIISSMSS